MKVPFSLSACQERVIEMLVIGISGQTGAGKSTLANLLSQRGFGENLEVDAVGHELLADSNVKDALLKMFGREIADANGQICRRSLGRKAFSSEEATQSLNSIMHPAMVKLVADRIATARRLGQSAIIINAALLFSMGLDSLCDCLVYVQADPEVRLHRLINYRSWAEDSARERLFAQDNLPANPGIFLVENNGDEAELAASADALAVKIRPGEASGQRCPQHRDCSFVNQALEKRIAEFFKLGAVPHCFFMELIKQPVLVAMHNQSGANAEIFASSTAFYENCSHAQEHIHSSFARLAMWLTERPDIRLHAAGGISVLIPGQEAAKLVVQAKNYLQTQKDGGVEDLEIADGQQMIFSTPDPELPAGFIEFLAGVFTPLDEVAAVYAFVMSKPGQVGDNLVVGVMPAKKISREEADRLSFLIIEGVDKYLEDRDQLDFMVIEDEELAKIASSVSPVINLGR